MMKITLTRYDGTNFLKTQEDINQYLAVAFASGDIQQIKTAIANSRKAQQKLHLKPTIRSNSLENIAKLAQTVGYHLTFTPSTSASL